MTRNFREMLERQWDKGNFVCVGLDSELEKVPQFNEFVDDTLLNFNERIVDTTKDLVCAYKPNIAFYEERWPMGWHVLFSTIRYINEVAPDVPVILDAKRADIGNTNAGYVKAIFDGLGADAVTVHPYLGAEAMKPFLARKGKGIFVLCKTSNPGAGEFQDLQVATDDPRPPVSGLDGTVDRRLMPLYQRVAQNVAEKWNKNGNCGLVVGATYPAELRVVRQIVGDIPILVPGIGAQGGDLEKTVKAGKDSCDKGMIINSSRGVIYASSGDDFAHAARREVERLRNAINLYREKLVSAP